jgi:hypothetical protein
MHLTPSGDLTTEERFLDSVSKLHRRATGCSPVGRLLNKTTRSVARVCLTVYRRKVWMQLSYRTVCTAIIVSLVVGVDFQGGLIGIATADTRSLIGLVSEHTQAGQGGSTICAPGPDLSDEDQCVVGRCAEEVNAFCATVDICYDFSNPVIYIPDRPDYCSTILDSYYACSDACL